MKKANISPLAERIERVRQYHDLTQVVFSKYLDITQGYYSDIINRGSGISAKIIIGLAINFPEINLRWLLTGEGEMLEKQGSAEHRLGGSAICEQPEAAYEARQPQPAAAAPLPGSILENIMRQIGNLDKDDQANVSAIVQILVNMLKKE